MKHYAALGAALILTGCTLTPEKELQTQSDNYQPAVESATSDCVFQSEVPLDPARCDLSFWLDYWAQVDQMTWPKRESLIEQLGDSPDMLLQKVILSQPVNTPYKARLRAQHWFEQLLPALSPANQQRMQAIAFLLLPFLAYYLNIATNPREQRNSAEMSMPLFPVTFPLV